MVRKATEKTPPPPRTYKNTERLIYNLTNKCLYPVKLIKNILFLSLQTEADYYFY